MPRMFLTFVALTMTALVSQAKAQELVTGVSFETISISSDFTGTELVVFGTINDMAGSNANASPITRDRYDIVVVIEGPADAGVVRRKDKIAGIWVNQDNVEFSKIPASYLMLTNGDPNDKELQSALTNLKLGFKNQLFGKVTQTNTERSMSDFRWAVVRLKTDKDLYTEETGVEFIGDNLFRAQFDIPALIPVGTHKVHSYLFLDKKLVSESEQTIKIQKTGFEQWMYEFSRNNGFVYGICCVLLAMLTGWLSSVAFRRD